MFAVQFPTVLALLATGADQRFGAEFVDQKPAVREHDRIMRGLEAVQHLFCLAGFAVDQLFFMLGKYSSGAVVWQTKHDGSEADVAATKMTRSVGAHQ